MDTLFDPRGARMNRYQGEDRLHMYGAVEKLQERIDNFYPAHRTVPVSLEQVQPIQSLRVRPKSSFEANLTGTDALASGHPLWSGRLLFTPQGIEHMDSLFAQELVEREPLASERDDEPEGHEALAQAYRQIGFRQSLNHAYMGRLEGTLEVTPFLRELLEMPDGLDEIAVLSFQVHKRQAYILADAHQLVFALDAMGYEAPEPGGFLCPDKGDGGPLVITVAPSLREGNYSTPGYWGLLPWDSLQKAAKKGGLSLDADALSDYEIGTLIQETVRTTTYGIPWLNGPLSRKDTEKAARKAADVPILAQGNQIAYMHDIAILPLPGWVVECVYSAANFMRRGMYFEYSEGGAAPRDAYDVLTDALCSMAQRITPGGNGRLKIQDSGRIVMRDARGLDGERYVIDRLAVYDDVGYDRYPLGIPLGLNLSWPFRGHPILGHVEIFAERLAGNGEMPQGVEAAMLAAQLEPLRDLMRLVLANDTHYGRNDTKRVLPEYRVEAEQYLSEQTGAVYANVILRSLLRLANSEYQGNPLELLHGKEWDAEDDHEVQEAATGLNRMELLMARPDVLLRFAIEPAEQEADVYMNMHGEIRLNAEAKEGEVITPANFWYIGDRRMLTQLARVAFAVITQDFSLASTDVDAPLSEYQSAGLICRLQEMLEPNVEGPMTWPIGYADVGGVTTIKRSCPPEARFISEAFYDALRSVEYAWSIHDVEEISNGRTREFSKLLQELEGPIRTGTLDPQNRQGAALVLPTYSECEEATKIVDRITASFERDADAEEARSWFISFGNHSPALLFLVVQALVERHGLGVLEFFLEEMPSGEDFEVKPEETFADAVRAVSSTIEKAIGFESNLDGMYSMLFVSSRTRERINKAAQGMGVLVTLALVLALHASMHTDQKGKVVTEYEYDEDYA